LAELLPYSPVTYSPVTGSGSGGIVHWNTLIKEAINGFELGCALSLHDSSLGKSILEGDTTGTDPFSGEIPENWESVYEPIIQDLDRRISACGTDGPSYKNMFPESGPELTQTAATKVIARQAFRGLILPFISEEVAEQILVNGAQEPGREPSSLKSMPIPELLTLVKQNAASVYRQWVELTEIDSSETSSDEIPYFAIVVLWSYAQGCDPLAVDDWCEERRYATETEALVAFEEMLIRTRGPSYSGKPFAGIAVESRDETGWVKVRSKAFSDRCKCSVHRGVLTKEEKETLASVYKQTIEFLQAQEKAGLEERMGPSTLRSVRATQIYDDVFAKEAKAGSTIKKSHSAGIDAANIFLGFSITGEDGLGRIQETFY
jgi:hypothetical protein